MATTPPPGGTSPKGTQPPALFTKRERYAVIGLSIFFIVASGVVHFVLGGASEKLFPHFKEEATPPPHVVTVMKFKPPPKPTPTPKPTTTPPPTPTPPPEKNTPPPLKLHVIKSHSEGGTGPAEQSYSPPPTGNPELGVPTAAATVAATAAPATAAPPTESGPVTAVDADFVHKVTPEYPSIAKDQQIQGTAVVLVTIGPSGTVLSASIFQSSGNQLLDNAALAAARASSFRPPTVNGVAVTRQYKIEYAFQLD